VNSVFRKYPSPHNGVLEAFFGTGTKQKKERERENGNLLAVWRCFAFAHMKKRFGNNHRDGFVSCLQVVKHKKKKKQERH
jgi:hypothetical protein